MNADTTATATGAARLVVYTCASAALSFARGVNDNARIAAVFTWWTLGSVQ